MDILCTTVTLVMIVLLQMVFLEVVIRKELQWVRFFGGNKVLLVLTWSKVIVTIHPFQWEEAPSRGTKSPVAKKSVFDKSSVASIRKAKETLRNDRRREPAALTCPDKRNRFFGPTNRAQKHPMTTSGNAYKSPKLWKGSDKRLLSPIKYNRKSVSCGPHHISEERLISQMK